MAKPKDPILEPYILNKDHNNCIACKITPNVPVATTKDTIGTVLSRIKDNIKKLNTVDYVYVVNENKNLIGVVSFKDLLRNKKETKIEKIMHKQLVTVSPEADPEKVADLAVKHNLKAVPVVKNKKLIGVVPIEQILPILNKALRVDLLRLGGIHKAHLKYENTLAVPLIPSILHRIPYLLIGLVGITLAALVINIFETTLEKYILLAFFIPAIVYMSDALGTQHQTLFIRDLAVMGKELNIRRYFLKQMVIGTLLAAIISGIIFLIITLFWKQPYMALIISIAMLSTLIFTSFTALAITLIIEKFKLDPALGSGPVATIISDVTSIILYFLIAAAFLGWT